jgi:hypothetical protein
MITHGTPPVAQGGWSAFIKNFGIGLRCRCLRTGGERACYHFATQPPDTGRDKTGLREFSGSEKPSKQGPFRTARYRNGRLFPVFKTGALNRSATLPSLEFSDLVGVWAGGKYQLPVTGGRRAPICAAVAPLSVLIGGPCENILPPA